MIEGVEINIAGRDYIVPALNFKSIRKLKAEIALISDVEAAKADGFGSDRMEAICKVAHAAFARNYPNLTLEELQDMVDLNNSGEIINAVMGISGLTRVKGEGDSESGEAKSPSTGTGSMQPSSPEASEAGSTSTSA